MEAAKALGMLILVVLLSALTFGTLGCGGGTTATTTQATTTTQAATPTTGAQTATTTAATSTTADEQVELSLVTFLAPSNQLMVAVVPMWIDHLSALRHVSLRNEGRHAEERFHDGHLEGGRSVHCV